MKVTKRQLSHIIREELDHWVRPDPEKTARAINRTSVEPEDAVGWIEDLVPHLEDADDEGRVMGHGGTAKMAKSQLFTIAQSVQSLHDRLQDDDEIPEWVQSKISAMLDDAHEVEDHLSYKLHSQEEEDEIELTGDGVEQLVDDVFGVGYESGMRGL
jgi:hypothetical protein